MFFQKSSIVTRAKKPKNSSTMGKKSTTEKRKSNQADLIPLHLKKPNTSDSVFTETPSCSSAQDVGLVNFPANNENQKLEPTLPLDSVKKKKKKKKKQKPSGLEEKPETVSPLESVTKNKKKRNRGFKSKTIREIFKEQLKGIFYVKDKCLDELLEKLSRSIEAMGQPKGKMYKIWMKQHFSVGINEVTRTLERMPVASNTILESYISDFQSPQDPFSNIERGHEESVPNKDVICRETEIRGQRVLLQAVLIAVDCHPRALVSHFPGLASSRGVPLFSVENHGSGSEQLGKLLKLKTAVAIGVKVGESAINKVIQDAIDDQDQHAVSKEDVWSLNFENSWSMD
ncbi:uncharacterized protein LOC131044847 isoform X2 [Cryptomeria japonica]|uniref:uncharacterized protein LOC131044847 isoform X2 n=1 Tax=Cryptomeria japonica TaxID=3369 RepID=UPI0027DA6BED|nr:uncharacterized protein LOC131044847 isoform X2 [Cryptomeria japonica]